MGRACGIRARIAAIPSAGQVQGSRRRKSAPHSPGATPDRSARFPDQERGPSRTPRLRPVCLPANTRPVAQPATEATNPDPTSAAPLPHRGRLLPEAPQRCGRRPAAAPEEDVVCSVQREEAVEGDEKRAEPFPRQPHPTEASRPATATKELGRSGCRHSAAAWAASAAGPGPGARRHRHLPGLRLFCPAQAPPPAPPPRPNPTPAQAPPSERPSPSSPFSSPPRHRPRPSREETPGLPLAMELGLRPYSAVLPNFGSIDTVPVNPVLFPVYVKTAVI